MPPASLLYDRRFLAAALILAASAPHYDCAQFGDNAGLARRRLAQEALDLADALIEVDEDSRIGPLGSPCPNQPLDPPF